ncbi:MAG: heavy-metal-associated domain-containing protein [Chitinophagaceae bacterium]|nr:MAG: heavy-metal-associated domain-containing protein [Chitinophagaceae bacterium]
MAGIPGRKLTIMKYVLYLIFSLSAASASAQFKTANLTASGLTCAMCTRAINQALDKLSFIESVNPNIETSTFEIRFKQGASVNFDAMRDAVEDAGFSISKLAVKTEFQNAAVKNDTHLRIGDKTFHFLKVSQSTLNGEKALVIVDKDFLPAKDYRKYSTATTMSCVKTGKAASCCTESGVAEGTRVYHVTI